MPRPLELRVAAEGGAPLGTSSSMILTTHTKRDAVLFHQNSKVKGRRCPLVPAGKRHSRLLHSPRVELTPPGAPPGPRKISPLGGGGVSVGKESSPCWPASASESFVRFMCCKYLPSVCVWSCASLNGIFYEQSCNIFYEQRSNGLWSRRHHVLQVFQGYHAVSLNLVWLPVALLLCSDD